MKRNAAHIVYVKEVWTRGCMISSVSFMVVCYCPVSQSCTDKMDAKNIDGTKPIHRHSYFHGHGR